MNSATLFIRFIYLFLIFLISTTSLSIVAKSPDIQLATIYRQDINVAEYWISEKLDGVRAYWNGQQLLSRKGHVFLAPSWFVADFPATPMDGELWIERGLFDKVSGIARQKRLNNQAWQVVRFMLFDLPQSTESFSLRVKAMAQLVERSKSSYLHMVEQVRVDDAQLLDAMLDNVIKAGGEGLMLHKQDAIYQAKRNRDLMKLKKYQDAEAVVIKYLPGKGKFSGKLGALLVKTNEGIVFKLGSGFSDKERENPPPIGAIVSYKYYGKTVNNKPRFASFMRIRR